jgi:hypothetical protein
MEVCRKACQQDTTSVYSKKDEQSFFSYRGDMMAARILFLCAQGSHRARLAASLLHAKYAAQWEAWSTPPLLLQQQVVEQVLQEQGLSLLPATRLIQPSLGQQWEQGIVLCSGGTAT